MITKISSQNEGLYVTFEGAGIEQFFTWFWLKDHGVDEASLDPQTLQRRVNTFGIHADIKPDDVQFDQGRQIVQISWADDTATSLTAELLQQVSGRKPGSESLAPDQPRVKWDQNNTLDELPSVDYELVMESDVGVYDWLSKIVVYGFCLVQNVPSTQADTEALAKRIGLIQETIFGTVWMLSAELKDHGDTAYSTTYLEPHTDGTYYRDAPGLQMFNCFEFDGKGGESILVDAFAIAEQIKQQDPEAYRILSEVSVPARYLEAGVHLHAERTPFRFNNAHQLEQVSFNNYDRAPFMLANGDMEQFYRAYSLFHQHALDQKNWLKIALRPGMTLIFDNWRTMHGRMGYVGKRVFCGCYHSRSEFESRLRTLQAEL